MNIVLTGHKGFIGNHYYNLINSSNQVFTFDKSSGEDLCNSNIVDAIPDCDVVVHMAATNGTKLFYEIPTDVAFNNTIPTFNLIKRFRNYK
jgi:nucleoside-diphosphate-sugar epimerase